MAIVDYNPLVYGENDSEGLVAVEHVERSGKPDRMTLFSRREDETLKTYEDFSPFIVADREVFKKCPANHDCRYLDGSGQLDLQASFASWKDFQVAKRWLTNETGFSASAPGAPFLCLNDPVQQFLISTGRTMFLGMAFEDIKRMQVDIECYTSPGYDFCNPERDGDRIIAIAVCDGDGVEVLSGETLEEKELIEKMVEFIRDRDPDVIEGHNIFNFDLSYIRIRAKKLGVKLALGRDGSVPKRRPSRMSIGERTLAYDRFDIYGRHVIDTLFLTHAYDVSHRSLTGFGLKEVAIHFGVAAEKRTYIEGPGIAEAFDKRPKTLMKYVRDDALETRAVGAILSQSGFLQAQMLPYSYQNATVRGNATKIDALMIREYLRQGQALPMPDEPRGFEGGYTDLFQEGVIRDVHHCDIRSLYPSLMLKDRIVPKHDDLEVFLKLLEVLKEFRIQTKDKMTSASGAERDHLDALQSTFKVLINSFYGYLGFRQGRFSDFDAAEQVTSKGRTLLKSMIAWLRKHGARPIEIDTDGIYFVPPEQNKDDGTSIDELRKGLAEFLPEGIEVEFDGEYESMYSYKMKNYALLTRDGEVIIKGAALKSRGLEPFQRSFLEEMIALRLHGKESEIAGLKQKYEKSIREQKFDINELAKTETLQDSPATYARKREAGRGSRRAAYELALASGRDYRAGDQVSYYVTGAKKSVAVHENSKLISEWDRNKRDENIVYYLSKLDALYKKFGMSDLQGELAL